MNPTSITVAALLYGDFPTLAERCLGSITTYAFPLCKNLKVGMNECSPRTHHYVRGLVAQNLIREENIYESSSNLKKYPVMRRILESVTTDYFMWFDDDSYIDKPGFLPAVHAALAANPAPDMLGADYSISLMGRQADWIKEQPWYAKKEIGSKIKFATGGWWVAKTAMLRKYDYPWPELVHRGGDVMLGALIHQQGLLLKRFRTGVKINADAEGRESEAPRRGYDESPIGARKTVPQPLPPEVAGGITKAVLKDALALTPNIKPDPPLVRPADVAAAKPKSRMLDLDL